MDDTGLKEAYGYRSRILAMQLKVDVSNKHSPNRSPRLKLENTSIGFNNWEECYFFLKGMEFQAGRVS